MTPWSGRLPIAGAVAVAVLVAAITGAGRVVVPALATGLGLRLLAAAVASRRHRARVRRRLRATVVVPAVPGNPPADGRGRRSLDAHTHLAASFGAAILLGLGLNPVLGLVVGAGLLAAPHVRARAARQREAAAVVDALPDLVDLVRLAVDAGLGVSEALATVADHLAVDTAPDDAVDPVAQALGRLRLRIARGDRLVDALVELGVLGEPARAFREALAASHRDGVPLAPALRRAAEDARDVRRRRREEVAHALPVKLILPLVCCTLPAVLLVTGVPVLSRALPSLAL